MTRTAMMILALLALGLISSNKTSSRKIESLKNTIYKFGFKTDSTSTGPLSNSAFIMKVNDRLPALFLTAHHTVAGTRGGQFLKWDEIEQNMINGWAWSMNDSTFNFKIGRNLPIRNAETLKLDLSAFYLPSDNKIPYLKPSTKKAQIGDTVYLFSKITSDNKTTLSNRGVVIYTTDSVMAYELTDFSMKKGIMSGTSGSCVLNTNSEVIANSYAGFTIPNDEIKKQIAAGFPLLNKLKTRDGKTYGIGVPIKLIEKSIILAFKEKN